MNSSVVIAPTQALATHHYPCTTENPGREPLVLLHGWGSASNSWQPLLPELQKLADVIALDLPGFGASTALADFSLDPVLELIAAQLPARCTLIGWSLGGMLAVQLAARYPQKISRVVTLAANAKFVATADYPSAMARTVNRQFNKGFAQDASATLKLFSGLLAQGDDNERGLRKQIRPLADADAINSNWLSALELLASLDNRTAFAQLSQPGLHLLAEKDVLVPASAVQALQALNPSQQVQVLAGAAHSLHWSQPAQVAQLLRHFLLPAPGVAKQAIAQSFSRAAQSYDSVASLQRNVGETLLQKLQPDAQAELVIDLGCGTGYFTGALQQAFPQAQVVGVDIAEGMLQFARHRHQQRFSWLCGDAEQLPIADQSVDVIFSSLALQWCANVLALLAELKRVLKPGGQLVFSTLGPRTLHELKTAWQQVDDYIHVNRFCEPELLLTQLQAQQLTLAEFARADSVLSFATVNELTRSLKALGAHNMNQGRAQGLGGRNKISAFKAAYEQFRSDGQLPATYDVYYIAARK